MVAHLLRLRLDLVLGSVRGPSREVVRTLAALGMLALGTAAASFALLSLRDTAADRAHAVLVLGGSVLVLGCLLAPILLGAADPLDPRRFGVFGMSPRVLPGALALAGLVSIPVVALAVLVVSAGVVHSAQGASLGIVILSCALAFVTCVLAVRCSLVVGSLVFRARRSRELSGLFLLVVLVVVVPVGVFVASLEWRDGVPSALTALVEVLAFTPLGAAWALPAAAATGAGATWGIGVVAVAGAGLLWVAWVALARRAMTTTERPSHADTRSGLGWFALMPGTPAGAIAARSLVYWLRDRRYIVNVVVVPIAAVLAALPLFVAGVPGPIVALIPVPIIALFLGWLPHNDVAYDSTAIWMHLAGGVRGVADRVGRLVPILLIGIPLLAVAIPISSALYGRWAITPALIGVAASMFLAGVGLSSIASVVAPYAVARPGDSPFQQPQRNGSSGVLSQALVMIGTLAVSAPSLWWAYLAITRDIEYATTAFWGGLIIGVVVLAVSIGAGGLAFDRRGDRIMEFAETA